MPCMSLVFTYLAVVCLAGQERTVLSVYLPLGVVSHCIIIIAGIEKSGVILWDEIMCHLYSMVCLLGLMFGNDHHFCSQGYSYQFF